MRSLLFGSHQIEFDHPRQCIAQLDLGQRDDDDQNSDDIRQRIDERGPKARSDAQEIRSSEEPFGSQQELVQLHGESHDFSRDSDMMGNDHASSTQEVDGSWSNAFRNVLT